MAQSISALPLSSDRSTFLSKPLAAATPFLKSFKPNTRKINNSIVSLAAGEPRGDLDHLQRVVVAKPQSSQSQHKRRVESPASVPIGSWDRFPTARTVQQMMETMERLMEDPLAYTSAAPTQNGSYSRGRTPWEIKEFEADYKMRFDMPGMTKEDVKVWVEEKMLVVQAEKAPKKKRQVVGGASAAGAVNGNGDGVAAGADGGVNVNEMEEEEEWPAKSYGRYRSRIALPENVQFEKIKAEVRDGVLYITVPKASVTTKVLDIAVQ